jgi:hypothetical protein
MLGIRDCSKEAGDAVDVPGSAAALEKAGAAPPESIIVATALSVSDQLYAIVVGVNDVAVDPAPLDQLESARTRLAADHPVACRAVVPGKM